ncbi:outer membrane beta-barrel protein [Alteromonas sp. a30]|uniref:outer membrane beta-barrel protein n=1 Tax=Alteromonas sp. a30 TaxID=2730917 RepID=UPI00227F527D|nr:outer membrane beta-barrel protein [Alteromonas sp. a30]MCY7296107.1 outer membrane beta-barrel protein [Alteromonas sp. a30]
MFTKLRFAAAVMAVSGFIPTCSYAANGVIGLDNGIDLTPSITLGYWNNDNITASEFNRSSSGEARMRANVLAELKQGRTEYSLNYNGVLGRYDDSENNYDDHQLNLGISTVASSTSELSGSFHYARLHEARGTGLSQGLAELINTPVEFDNLGFDLNWKYSFLAERFWMEAALSYLEKEYQNAEVLSANLDNDQLQSQVSLFWRTGNESSIFVQGRHTLIDYDDDSLEEFTRDGNDYRLLAGLRWSRGALGYGSLGFGFQKKQFDSALREEFNGFSWEVKLAWNPLERLGFEVESSRASVEPPLNGDYVRQISHALSMGYNVSERIRLTSYIDYADLRFVGIERDEEKTNFGVGLVYAFRSNISVELTAKRQDNDSNLDGYSYEQNVIGLDVTLGLK